LETRNGRASTSAFANSCENHFALQIPVLRRERFMSQHFATNRAKEKLSEFFI